jgi:ABC-type nitrate/sulfonate/bicarbonate transport system permease component
MSPQPRAKFDWQARAIQAAFVLALLALWYYVGRNGLVSAIFLPKLPGVVDKLIQIVQSSAFYGNLGVTLFELLVAVAIASTLGLTIGYLVGRSRYAVLVFEPLLAGVFAVPLVVFLPLFILFFGIGVESKIAFGATYAFFPIVLNTIGGISQVDPRFVTVARSMGASERQLFRRVLLPAALPVIVSGLRIGCTIGFLAILGSEMIAGLRGLGSRIVSLAEGMNTAEMFAYIVFVIILAMVLNITLSRMQSRFGDAGRRA